MLLLCSALLLLCSAVLLPCSCRAPAVFLPCSCRVPAVPYRAPAVFLPCSCRAPAVPLPCDCRVRKEELVPGLNSSLCLLDCLPCLPSCTSTQQALIGMADDSEITVRCACGVPEVDGLMIGCDACDGWEHLSCRGLLKAPPEEEAHNCHGCLKTNNPDLKMLCLKRRALDHLRCNPSTITSYRLGKALGRTVTNQCCRELFEDLVQAGFLTMTTVYTAAVNEKKIKDNWNKYFKDKYEKNEKKIIKAPAKVVPRHRKSPSPPSDGAREGSDSQGSSLMDEDSDSQGSSLMDEGRGVCEEYLDDDFKFPPATEDSSLADEDTQDSSLANEDDNKKLRKRSRDLEAENERLKDDNKKLRKRSRDLEAENERLKECDRLKVKQRKEEEDEEEEDEGEEEEKEEKVEKILKTPESVRDTTVLQENSTAINKLIAKLSTIPIQQSGSDEDKLKAIHTTLNYKAQGYAKKILKTKLAKVATCHKCSTPRGSSSGFESHVAKCKPAIPVPLEYLKLLGSEK